MQNQTTIEKQTLAELQDLIEINLNSAKGFMKAASETKRPHLANLFREFSEERDTFARELQSEVRRHGEVPETDGSWKGKVHRWWMDLRNDLASDEHALYAEMERGEDKILAAYRDAAKQVQGSPFSLLVGSQKNAVQRGHDRVKALRDASK